MRSEQINELATALAKAQGSIPNATMNKVNPHFKSKYADLASVRDAIREPLSANGLAVTQTMENKDGSLVLVTTVIHTSGQWMASEYPLPSVARPQEMGSALTYARRYSLAAIVCNSADEDDDAEAAEGGKLKIAANVIEAKVVDAPHDPVTGDAGPHAIAIPQQQDGSNDWISFGQLMLAACRSGSSDEWLSLNSDNCASMAQQAPKIHKRMMAALEKAAA
jgi:hypothetical protein